MVEDLVRRRGYLTLGSRLRRIGEMLQAETQSVMAAHGVPLQGNHYPTLAAIDENGPLTIGNLAEALGISQPGATRIVAQLVKKAVVTAGPGPDDQRQKIVSLTDYGKELVEHGRAAVWPLIQSCVAQILDDQRGPILSQLDHLEDELHRKPFLDRIQSK